MIFKYKWTENGLFAISSQIQVKRELTLRKFSFIKNLFNSGLVKRYNWIFARRKFGLIMKLSEQLLKAKGNVFYTFLRLGTPRRSEILFYREFWTA